MASRDQDGAGHQNSLLIDYEFEKNWSTQSSAWGIYHLFIAIFISNCAIACTLEAHNYPKADQHQLLGDGKCFSCSAAVAPADDNTAPTDPTSYRMLAGMSGRSSIPATGVSFLLCIEPR